VTLRWDAAAGRTRVMRSKEEAEDYRYFPEPDLPPLAVDDAWREAVWEALPELPRTKERRLAVAYGISEADAAVLTASRGIADYFEAVAVAAGEGKSAANWVLTEILHLVRGSPRGLADVRVDPRRLGKLVRMIREGTISHATAKTVFAEMAQGGGDPGEIVRARGLELIEDARALARAVTDVLDAHPQPLADALAGKDAPFRFLVGQVMRATEGRADPQAVQEALRAALEERRHGRG